MRPPMFWIPNGAYPLGIAGSVKPPRRWTRANLLLNTSTVPSWKLAAYRNVPWPVRAKASPLKTAVLDLNITCAVDLAFVIGSAAGLQAVTRPDSETKMNRAGPLPALELTTKPVVGLNTCPSGLGPSPVEVRAPGMVTVSGALVTVVPPGGIE